jgi:hypothetical protein
VLFQVSTNGDKESRTRSEREATNKTKRIVAVLILILRTNIIIQNNLLTTSLLQPRWADVEGNTSRACVANQRGLRNGLLEGFHGLTAIGVPSCDATIEISPFRDTIAAWGLSLVVEQVITLCLSAIILICPACNRGCTRMKSGRRMGAFPAELCVWLT